MCCPLPPDLNIWSSLVLYSWICDNALGTCHSTQKERKMSETMHLFSDLNINLQAIDDHHCIRDNYLGLGLLLNLIFIASLRVSHSDFPNR